MIRPGYTVYLQPTLDKEYEVHVLSQTKIYYKRYPRNKDYTKDYIKYMALYDVMKDNYDKN